MKKEYNKINFVNLQHLHTNQNGYFVLKNWFYSLVIKISDQTKSASKLYFSIKNLYKIYTIFKVYWEWLVLPNM